MSRDVSAGPTTEADGTPLPTGTVTFVFTDIEGSTRLWETDPEAMAQALGLHNDILRCSFDRNSGVVFSTMGDGMAVAFSSAVAAARAVIDAQQGLVGAPWPSGTGALKVRMGMHTDEGTLHRGQYLNQPLNRCARLMSAAHGGQILLSDTTESLVRSALPEGAHLVDLGDLRLRDLSGPMHVFQLVHPALPANFGPLRSVERPGNLPLQVSSFVGRGADMAAVRDALRGSRLVTLTGPGGVGKTRLALETAGMVSSEHRDGCWLCELAAAADGDSAVQVVATSLGVSPRPGLSAIESIVAFARSKEMLIVLDNCEHVLSAAADLADGLLQNCPSVSVLATSRQELRVEGEQALRLGALPVAEAGTGIEEIERSDAVRLFVDRAVAVRHDFVLEAHNATAVADITRRPDGVPLAIELGRRRLRRRGEAGSGHVAGRGCGTRSRRAGSSGCSSRGRSA